MHLRMSVGTRLGIQVPWVTRYNPMYFRTQWRPWRASVQTLLLAVLVLVGCQTEMPVDPGSTSEVSKYDATVAVAWFDLQLRLVQNTPGFTPPVASRSFGYSGVALYEALVPGMSDRRSLVGQLNGLTSLPQPESGTTYHWPSVASSAMATITRHMFGNATDASKASIDSLAQHFEAALAAEAGQEVHARSVEYGRSVADAVYEWSKTDGGHQAYLNNFPTDYTPPVGPGMWVPTPRRSGAPLRALQPYWGQVRPFVLPKGNPNLGIDPGPPPAFSTDTASDFYKEAMEVYGVVRTLTPEQNEIALYWADDPGATCTPPGHSVSILCQCIKAQNNKLDAAAEAYARMGIAVADAFIACWESKYRYNLLRPISYINQYIDPNWNTPVITDPVETPPFPEYTSGHSVQSGAAAEVLEGLYGRSFAFTDHTHDGIGMEPRSFGSFDEFAQEAAISRLYGGIHYRAAIERGVTQGRKIGQKVNGLKFKR